MAQGCYLFFVVMVTISTTKSQLGLGFDGFITFLKEMGELKARLRSVQQTGRALSAKSDALEAAILKMNKTMGNSIGSVAATMDKTFNLRSRVQDISVLVETSKQNMTKLQKLNNATIAARQQLNNLANNKTMVTDNLKGKVETLQSIVDDLQNITHHLQEEKNQTEELYEDMANTTDRVELMGCDSGFNYKDSSFPSTTNIRFQRPFSSTPSVLYGMTQVDRAKFTSISGYTLVVNVTKDNLDEAKLTMTMKKSERTTLRSLEFGWMACHL